MGIFGLGAPEIAVIVGVGLLLFGPKKLADYGKKAGSLAGDVKKATAEFRDAMDESLTDADAEIDMPACASCRPRNGFRRLRAPFSAFP